MGYWLRLIARFLSGRSSKIVPLFSMPMPCIFSSGGLECFLRVLAAVAIFADHAQGNPSAFTAIDDRFHGSAPNLRTALAHASASDLPLANGALCSGL